MEREFHRYDLFATPVLSTVLNNIDIKSIEKECLKIEKSGNGRVRSNVGGFQSHDVWKYNTNVFDDLQKQIFSSVQDYINVFKVGNFQVKLTEFWFNVNRYKDYNQPHTHPYSVVSGAFYVSTPDKCGRLALKHPNEQLLHRDWINTMDDEDFNTINSANWYFNIEPKQLTMFPGWAEHYTEPNLNKTKPRISFSFNFQHINETIK